MNDRELERWVRAPRNDLTSTVAREVAAQWHGLRSRCLDPYGYVLLPPDYSRAAEPHHISAVWNFSVDIAVAADDASYTYYRYCPNEWKHGWDERHAFDGSARLIRTENERFVALHTRDDDSYLFDELELAYHDAVLTSILHGLAFAKASGVFGAVEPFLALWLFDSEDPVMGRSIRDLNPAPVAAQVIRELTL